MQTNPFELFTAVAYPSRHRTITSAAPEIDAAAELRASAISCFSSDSKLVERSHDRIGRLRIYRLGRLGIIVRNWVYSKIQE